ncbi:YrdB family protein [Metabacillus dongyingensis]|uniref:YrdB family protein n=1 Tax=Metabacillus dongyingensis TaxID=2874282 RepID=UPI003B8D908D
MIFVQYAVLSILFLLELSALMAFMYWGFQIDKGILIKIVFGLGTPVLVAIIWGTFIAPKASLPVSVPVRIFLQLLIFSLAAVALYCSEKSMLATIFFIVVLIDMTLMYLMKL